MDRVEKKIRLLPTIEGVFLICLLLMALRPIESYDFFWHLRAGRDIVQTLHIPKTDPYTASAKGKRWIAHEWGSEVLFYTVYSIFRWKGLLFFKGLCIFLIAGLILKNMRKKNITIPVRLISTILVMKVMSHAWTLRPHLFAVLLLLFAMDILPNLNKKCTGTLLLWLTTVLIWANIHASFILAPILVLIEILFNKEKKYLSIVLLLTLSVICINPNGYELLLYPFSYAPGSHHQWFIAEWKAPALSTEPVFWAYLFFLWGTLGITSRKKWCRICQAGLFSYLALTSRRYIPFFAVGTAVIFSEQLEDALIITSNRLFQKLKKISGRLNKLQELYAGKKIILAADVITIFITVMILPLQPVNEKIFPVSAVRYMRENHLKGSIFNEYRHGGYILWYLYPDIVPWVDGRADLHDKKFFEDYDRAINYQGDNPLPKTDWILISRKSLLSKYILLHHLDKIIYINSKDILAANYYGE